MKNSHRFSEPYPENPRKPKVKTTDRTKIELELEDAHRLADIIDYTQRFIDYEFDTKSIHLINLLIKKLRNAEPELEF